MNLRGFATAVVLVGALAMTNGCSSGEDTAKISRSGTSSTIADPSAPDDSTAPDASEAPDDVATTKVPSPTGTFPSYVRSNFIEACSENSSEQVCTCSIDYIEERVSLDEFIALEKDFVDSGELPEVIQESVETCA